MKKRKVEKKMEKWKKEEEEKRKKERRNALYFPTLLSCGMHAAAGL